MAASAKDHIVDTPVGKIIFVTADNEVSQRKFFGADLWFTGKVKNKKRNVMSILYNSSDVKLNPIVSKKEFKVHKEKMKIFAKKRKYSNIKFKPYKYVKLNDKLAYHHFVWSYEKQGEIYLEQSYYVECSHIFFVAKATTFQEAKDDQKKFKKIIEGVKCQK